MRGDKREKHNSNWSANWLVNARSACLKFKMERNALDESAKRVIEFKLERKALS